METSIVKTFSFDSETLNKLQELCKEKRVNRSLLVRLVINYFYENKEQLEELIKEHEGK